MITQKLGMKLLLGALALFAGTIVARDGDFMVISDGSKPPGGLKDLWPTWVVEFKVPCGMTFDDALYAATSTEWPALFIPVHSSGGQPYILSWDPSTAGEDFRILKYWAGEVGTSEKYHEIRMAVVGIWSGKVIADETFAWLDTETQRPSGPQPEWSWSNDKLTIKALGKTKTWNLKEAREGEVWSPKPVWTGWIDSGHLAPALPPTVEPVELLFGVIGALELANGVGDWINEVAMRVDYAGPYRRIGIIAQRNMKDDSVGGAEYRVTMEREGGLWQIAGLEKRRLCWRGMTENGACL